MPQGPARKPKVGRYANVFRVGFNAFEMVMEFGERFSDDDDALMHTRIITNPALANDLVRSLNDALTKYARAYSLEPPDKETGAKDEHGSA